MKRLLNLGIGIFLIEFSYGQGKIDVDPVTVQMGIGTNVHVNLTADDFTVQDDAGLPLIFGDFGNGYVGIGSNSLNSRLNVMGDIQISNASLPMGLMTEVGGTTPLLNMSVNFREPNKTNSYLGAAFRIDGRSPSVNLFQWLARDAGTSTENTLMVLTQSGNLGIGTTPGASTKLDVNGSVNVTGNQTVTGSLSIAGNINNPSLSSFRVQHVSGTTTVGTMGSGDTWMITVPPRNFGGSDNRGGCWIVGYTGTVMSINQIFKWGHTTSLYHGGGGLVLYNGGGGAPVNTISVLKISD